MASMGVAINAAIQTRWQQSMAMFPRNLQQFIEAKWRLPLDWAGSGSPPRPCRVEELADSLGFTPQRVREVDWELVEIARDMQRRLHILHPRFLAIPIDAAQGWWDEWCSPGNYSDGQLKPPAERRIGEAERRQGEEMSLVHTIESPEELRMHLIRDHRCEWARRDELFQGFHSLQHSLEAQDSEWDQRFGARAGIHYPERQDPLVVFRSREQAALFAHRGDLYGPCANRGHAPERAIFAVVHWDRVFRACWYCAEVQRSSIQRATQRFRLSPRPLVYREGMTRDDVLGFDGSPHR